MKTIFKTTFFESIIKDGITIPIVEFLSFNAKCKDGIVREFTVSFFDNKFGNKGIFTISTPPGVDDSLLPFVFDKVTNMPYITSIELRDYLRKNADRLYNMIPGEEVEIEYV